MNRTNSITNAEQLRELAQRSSTLKEFQNKAISGVMLKMTILEFEAEMEYMNTGDLQDYFEKVKNGGEK